MLFRSSSALWPTATAAARTIHCYRHVLGFRKCVVAAFDSNHPSSTFETTPSFQQYQYFKTSSFAPSVNHSSSASLYSTKPSGTTLISIDENIVEDEITREKERTNLGIDGDLDDEADADTTSHNDDDGFSSNSDNNVDTLMANSPADQPKSIRFFIVGDPQPLRRHRVANNRMYNPSSAEQKRFLEKARPFMPAKPLIGPLEASVIFRMKRPKTHYRTGRYSHLLKKDVPRFHTSRIDLDNLVKLVLDSLNEHAYVDDRQVVSVRAVKEYCNLGLGSTDVTLSVLDDEAGGKGDAAAAAGGSGCWWEREGDYLVIPSPDQEEDQEDQGPV